VLVILILLLLGALPTWPYSAGWGYYPSGGLGLVLLIVVILALTGRLWKKWRRLRSVPNLRAAPLFFLCPVASQLCRLLVFLPLLELWHLCLEELQAILPSDRREGIGVDSARYWCLSGAEKGGSQRRQEEVSVRRSHSTESPKRRSRICRQRLDSVIDGLPPSRRGDLYGGINKSLKFRVHKVS